LFAGAVLMAYKKILAKNTLQSILIYVSVLLWFVVAYSLLRQFTVWDWAKGSQRSILAIVFGLCCVSFYKKRKFIFQHTTNNKVNKWINIVFFLFSFVLLATTIKTGFASYKQTSKNNYIPLDQGQNTYRSYLLLKKAHNPYQQNMFLDVAAFNMTMRDSSIDRGCLRWEHVNIKKFLPLFYNDLNVGHLKHLLPKVKELSTCKREKLAFTSMGYKYGPAMLLVYAPFIEVFGKGGIFICHLVFALALIGFLMFFFYSSIIKNAFAFLICSMLLFIPTHLTHNGFINSANDIIPTVLVVCGYLLIQKNKAPSPLGSLLVALSIATKLLPGLLFVLLLFTTNKKNILYSVIFLSLFFLPFIIWNPQGLANNLILFNFIRPTDTTTIMHYISPTVTVLVRAVSLVSIVALFYFLIYKRHNSSRQWLFVILSALIVLASAKAMHNNYFVWIQVILATSVLVWLSPQHHKAADS
jgi:hypothetical protein